ncbi:MAG TPA: Hpt domain-containing protein [Acidimicrobiales bacterium]|nr:Hpt domain-containing protein [Acidimicrobiales bacterium]
MSDVLSDPLDRSQIELLLSLDDGEGAALREIVDEYLAMSEDGQAKLLRALDERDQRGVEHAAHALKGASANVGAAAVAEVCGAMEARARQAQLQGAAVLTERFESELCRARAALQAVMQKS